MAKRLDLWNFEAVAEALKNAKTDQEFAALCVKVVSKWSDGIPHLDPKVGLNESGQVYVAFASETQTGFVIIDPYAADPIRVQLHNTMVLMGSIKGYFLPATDTCYFVPEDPLTRRFLLNYIIAWLQKLHTFAKDL